LWPLADAIAGGAPEEDRASFTGTVGDCEWQAGDSAISFRMGGATVVVNSDSDGDAIDIHVAGPRADAVIADICARAVEKAATLGLELED
jgi:hypothetical protein